jgi:hypothetical protein
MQILSLANREESLCRGTALWDQCVAWLHAGSNDQSEWNTAGIQQYLEASVTKYLQTDLGLYKIYVEHNHCVVRTLINCVFDNIVFTKE